MADATLAALATIPRRLGLLQQSLESLRPQVDRLCVYLNGHHEVPQCVLDMADEYVLDKKNSGAECKLHWSERHDGIYLSVDDDFRYPPDYVNTMVAAVERWKGRALVTAHGRVYVPNPRNVHDVRPGSVGLVQKRIDNGRWINHGGSGVMAWDARRVRVPSSFPERNIVDMQLAVWAQKNRVPMWLIPHQGHWLKSSAMLDPHGLFRSSQAEGHRRRNTLLRQHRPWVVHEP